MDNKQNFEVGDVSPSILEHFIGQKRVVDRIRVILEASWNDGTRLPHILMNSGPGLGKTQLCSIIAKETGCELKQVLAQNLTCPQQLNGFLMDSADKDVLLIDEIHELPSMLQTALYRAMENGLIFVNGAMSKKPMPVKLPNISICGCTTDPHMLLRPLVDRFKVILSFEFYTNDELEQLLRNRTKALKWDVEDKVFSMIAQRGQGIPRIALRLLSSVRITARSQNDDRITTNHAIKTFEQLECIDDRGLGPEQRKYLEILAEHNTSVRLNVISSRMGCTSQRNISECIEPYLIRAGLITKLDSGRILTAAGLEYVRTHVRATDEN